MEFSAAILISSKSIDAAVQAGCLWPLGDTPFCSLAISSLTFSALPCCCQCHQHSPGLPEAEVTHSQIGNMRTLSRGCAVDPDPRPWPRRIFHKQMANTTPERGIQAACLPNPRRP